MRGVKSDDLLAIVDFLYHGEANVYQENLDSFLALAEELQLKGLMGKAGDGDEVIQRENIKMPISRRETQSHKSISQDRGAFQTNSSEEVFVKELDQFEGTLALPSFFSGDLQELERKCQSMMEKTGNKHANGVHVLFRCNVCGKEDLNQNLKNHIEICHLEGVSIPCKFCEKTFRSRKQMSTHNHQKHKSL